MNIIDFTKKFHDIEDENNLFEVKDSNNLFYWDIIRHDLFYLIYYQVAKLNPTKPVATNRNVFSFIKRNSRRLIKFVALAFKTRFCKYKYLCFVASRNHDINNKLVDTASNDVLNLIHGDALLIELFNSEKEEYKFEVNFDYGVLIEKIKLKIKMKTNLISLDSNYSISKLLANNFGQELDFDSEISNRILEYNAEYSHYLKLLKRISPSVIFYVQYGIRKGMFSAAKTLNIPTVELQHGYVGYSHPAYSYPQSISLNSNIFLTDFFFSFSKFWTAKTNYPVRNIVPIGNNYYSIKDIKKSCKKYDLTFILADVYMVELREMLDQLIKEDSEIKICLKLHPNQKHDLNSLKSTYGTLCNIDVVFTEISLEKILASSKAIFAIQSTCVYEALQYGNIKIFIFKKADYFLHEDIFDNPNVYLIDNLLDLLDSLAKDYVFSEKNLLFEEFKIDVFSNFLKTINN